jgi:hypothetical protein
MYFSFNLVMINEFCEKTLISPISNVNFFFYWKGKIMKILLSWHDTVFFNDKLSFVNVIFSILFVSDFISRNFENISLNKHNNVGKHALFIDSCFNKMAIDN